MVSALLLKNFEELDLLERLLAETLALSHDPAIGPSLADALLEQLRDAGLIKCDGWSNSQVVGAEVPDVKYFDPPGLLEVSALRADVLTAMNMLVDLMMQVAVPGACQDTDLYEIAQRAKTTLDALNTRLRVGPAAFCFGQWQ